MISFGQSQRRGQSRPDQARQADKDTLDDKARCVPPAPRSSCCCCCSLFCMLVCGLCSAQESPLPRAILKGNRYRRYGLCLGCLRSTLLSKQHDLCFVLRAVRITRCLPTPTKPHYPIPIPNRSQESVHGHPLPVDVDVWHLIVH